MGVYHVSGLNLNSVSLFEKSALNEFMIYSHHDRETVVLKDNDKNEIDYPDTEETESQRYVVTVLQ